MVSISWRSLRSRSWKVALQAGGEGLRKQICGAGGSGEQRGHYKVRPVNQTGRVRQRLLVAISGKAAQRGRAQIWEPGSGV